VLAILVIIAALAVPAMQGTFARAALHGGGDLVRGAWAKARFAAMESGQVYAFRFEPNGRRFQIVTLDAVGLPESSELAPDDPDAQQNVADMLRVPKTSLPEGVIFAGGDVATSSQVAAALPGAVEGPWSMPVLFRPDGTTSDASITLINDRKQSIRVTLRGLTGISNATDVGDEELP
jgi:Tfp pilus assembly protein FimT